jgi:hypothetical protein
MTLPSDTDREADINTVIEGNFTADALGPAYHELLSRLREAPEAYLDTFERMFVDTPAPIADLSHLYLPTFLEYLAPEAPERVAAISQRLLGQVESTARVIDQMIEQFGESETPQEAADLAEDLEYRRRELRVLTGAVA